MRTQADDAARAYERRIVVLSAETEMLARTNHELRDTYPLHRRADLDFGGQRRDLPQRIEDVRREFVHPL